MMMMMNMKDDWVAAALSDDTLVADLLSRLNQSSSQPPKPTPSLSLPLGWGHRQPRSKLKKDSANTTTTRCSPTTPLSWSGGGGAASPSDGDYSNSNSNSNSSRLASDLSRSKIDLNLHAMSELYGTSGHALVVFSNLTNQMEASTRDHTHSTLPRHAAAHEGVGSSSVCRVSVEKKIDMQKKDYLALPDLNTMPSEEEEDGGPEMVNGMS